MGSQIATSENEKGIESYLDTARADSIAYYRRRLASEIEREGIERKDRHIPIAFDVYENDAHRYRVWRLDSLLWAFESLAGMESDPALYAFRALLQAMEYTGHVPHSSLTHDATIELRNAIERVIRGRS